jgi:hypothetical protein
VSKSKLINPHLEAQKLLAMHTPEAETVFQGYSTGQQLEVISATRSPGDREELYYLVPDCTELIQKTPTVDVLQILDTMLGTGMASVLLPCLSPEQFEEMMDLSLWRNGTLDEKSLNLWLFELSECERDELGYLLSQVDIRLIASMLRDRVEIKTDFKALFIEEGIIDPLSREITYADEQARDIMVAIWQAGEELFTRLLYEMFALDKEDEVPSELERALEYAKETRAERVRERDLATGIDITEEEILEKVDLDNLDLAEDDAEELDEYGIENDDEQKES